MTKDPREARMIKPEQIPEAVIKQFSTWQFPKCTDSLMRSMLADTLSAWPFGAVCHYTIKDTEGWELILPLPQEARDE